jgi:hypothetical protein
MLDKEPFSKIFSAYCLGGPFYAFMPKFNDIPALQKENKKKRNNIIKIYSPPELSVTMTHFIYHQTLHAHYVVQNLLNHNKSMLPLLHMHPRSHEFIKTKLSEETKM